MFWQHPYRDTQEQYKPPSDIIASATSDDSLRGAKRDDEAIIGIEGAG